jgi:DNA-binding transcriptional regulator YbjK
MADAALEILAQLGARGTTHRAVDRALALPDGSTSFYFRTRSALLLGAAQRLIELDVADLLAVPKDKSGTTDLVVLWTSPARRTRSLARLELLLSAARDPAFRFMQEARTKFIEGVSRAGQRTATTESRITGVALIALVDGLTLHGLLARKLTKAEAAMIVERLGRSARP